jgi:hypothetical protein
MPTPALNSVRNSHGGALPLAPLDYANGIKSTMDASAKTLTPASAVCRVANTGSVTVYIRADGQAAVSAAKETVPLPAGEVIDVVLAPGASTLSIIGASGDVFVMPYLGTSL